MVMLAKKLDETEGSLVVRRQLDLTLVWVRCCTDVALVRCWKRFIDSEGKEVARMII